jgi:hypothetical protein
VIFVGHGNDVASFVRNRFQAQKKAAGSRFFGRRPQPFGTYGIGDLDGQIPTRQNLHFSADHSIPFVARRSRGFFCLDRVDAAPFQDIAHEQLGLGLVHGWIEKINRGRGSDAQ